MNLCLLLHSENNIICDMKRALSLFTAICAIAEMAMAGWHTPIKNFSRESYGAGRQNWAVDERHDGWIYIANEYGLLEYDGTRWSLYGMRNSVSPRSVMVNGDTVYCGGANEFGRFVNDNMGGMRYESLSENTVKGDFGEVWGIEKVGETLNFMTKDAVLWFAKGDSTVRIVESASRLIDMFGANDTLFVARTDGLFYLRDGRRWEMVKGSDRMATFDIKCMTGRGKRLIVCTAKGGMWEYSGGTLRRIPTAIDKFIEKNMPYSIATRGGKIAVGTVTGGVGIVDEDGDNGEIIGAGEGLQNSTVLEVTIDAAGDLWCGLDLGISKIELSSPLRMLYGAASGFGSGYAWMEDNHQVYIGTNRGLFVSPYPFEDGNFEGSMVEGSVGQVWGLGRVGERKVCCHDRGLFEIEDTGSLRKVIGDDGIWDVHNLPNGRAVAGGYSGMYIVEEQEGRVVYVKKIDGAPNKAKNFEVDTDGRVWISTERGIERLTLSTDGGRCAREIVKARPEWGGVFSNVMKIGHDIVVSMGENSWVADSDGTLHEDGVIERMDGANVFYDCAAEDNDGRLWWVTSSKLRTRDANAKESRTIWDMPLLYVYGFTKIYGIGEGHAVVNCVEGFAQAESVVTEKGRGGVFVRRLSVLGRGGKEIVWGYGGEADKEAEVGWQDGMLRVEFGGVGCKEYSCRLARDGVGEFSEWGTSGEREYGFLDAGEYEFTVAGQDGSKASVKFRVKGPWWWSWWAKLGYIMAGAGMVCLLVWYARLRMSRQKGEELREREREILLLRNARMEDMLKSKSQELSTMMLGALDKNDLVVRVRREVGLAERELRNGETGMAEKRLGRLEARLSEDSEARVDWKRFEENFDFVNSSFLKKLQARFPWISENEKRLCVYVVMDLMNKEIAPLMNISVRGVEMLRYRMRKKMELEREDDLQALLRGIRDGE